MDRTHAPVKAHIRIINVKKKSKYVLVRRKK